MRVTANWAKFYRVHFRPQVLHNSLKSLLEHTDDDVEDVYMQTFRISYNDMFGNIVYHDLIPDGDQTPVTMQNKKVPYKEKIFIALYRNKNSRLQAPSIFSTEIRRIICRLLAKQIN